MDPTGLLFRIVDAIPGLYRRTTVASRRALPDKLDRLAYGITHEYLQLLFGPPVGRSRSEDGALEHVYRTPHALIATLADQHSIVRAYSITVTDEKFTYPVARIRISSRPRHRCSCWRRARPRTARRR